MAPGGGAFKEAIESHSKYLNSEMSMMKAEIGNTPIRSSTSVAEKHGINGVHELLQCPSCADSMYPPIHQCPNGHTLCANCRRVHSCCPTCRFELGNIRCLALEKVAESLELPCRYQSLGCRGLFPYYNKLKHEKHCSFRPYTCPYASSECSVTGDIPFLVAHLKEDHSVDMHDGCTFNHRYVKSNPREVENATWMLTVFNCFGRQFCLHFEAFLLGTAPVYMAFLRFMGEDRDAKKFCYTLEVGAFGRKLVWQGVPRSIRDSHRKVRDSQDGLVIPRSLALYFSAGDGQELKLRVTGRIWKV
ncbi:E3 ubiquitin-protein ligase SINAT2 [Sesamum indicum]|uniref:RING-type E3 ubiquitin transferase n=1 Tax=Sesamum indicum TaxID=4182 RepID=A0A6I9T441_SESIN|nr:E3 ubiquitin-protein ligase SINAT2 [Sesamum indicum]